MWCPLAPFATAGVLDSTSIPGVSTHLYIVLDSPYTVVALANIDPPAAEQGSALARSLLIARANQGR